MLIDRLHATRWTPPNYWQTDNSNGPVMVVRNYHWLNSASLVLISTCSAPLVQMGEQFITVWPLTYDLGLQSQASQGQGRPSCQKSRAKVKRFKQESAHRQTDGHTDGRYQTYYLPCYAVDNITSTQTWYSALLMSMGLMTVNAFLVLTLNDQGLSISAFSQYRTDPCLPSNDVDIPLLSINHAHVHI